MSTVSFHLNFSSVHMFTQDLSTVISLNEVKFKEFTEELVALNGDHCGYHKCIYLFIYLFQFMAISFNSPKNLKTL